MNRFLQLHLLTSYPPANLNRDDLGRPKTAVMGGVLRLRISSQSLKRAWRTSDVFESVVRDHIGKRTKRIGAEWIEPIMRTAGIDDSIISQWSPDIQRVFGEVDDDKPLFNKQLTHVSPTEEKALHNLIGKFSEFLRPNNGAPIEQDITYLLFNEVVELREKREQKTKKEDKEKITKAITKKLAGYLLTKAEGAADIALFGRMLASSPDYNVEAAAQVAHALAVHRCQVEDDFFTAVDDLNQGIEDVGAGHMGETEFGAALFYLYLCIDRQLLLENLNNDRDLCGKTLQALTECAATIAPTGKQNSFATRARASFVLAEKGDAQPRSLSVAFLKPVGGDDLLGRAIAELTDCYGKMDQVYGACAAERYSFNTTTGEGKLAELLSFVCED